MPKIVDHDRRREDIARVVVQVIQREGAEAATVRRIARAGGFSIGVLSHYFRDKDDLVVFAFQWVADRTFAGLRDRAAAQPPGIERLRTAFEYMLPAPRTPSFIAVWMGLWSGAVHRPALAQVHRAYYVRWRRALQGYLAEAVRAGQIPAPRSMRDTLDLLVGALDGLWIAATFEPARFGPRRRRQLVGALLAGLRGEAS